MLDTLTQARDLLSTVTQAAPTGYFKGGEKLPKEWLVTLIQLNTQIAIAERMDKLIALLETRGDDGVFRVEAWCLDQRREPG